MCPSEVIVQAVEIAFARSALVVVLDDGLLILLRGDGRIVKRLFDSSPATSSLSFVLCTTSLRFLSERNESHLKDVTPQRMCPVPLSELLRISTSVQSSCSMKSVLREPQLFALM